MESLKRTSLTDTQIRVIEIIIGIIKDYNKTHNSYYNAENLKPLSWILKRGYYLPQESRVLNDLKNEYYDLIHTILNTN